MQVPVAAHMHVPPWQMLPAGHALPHDPLKLAGGAVVRKWAVVQGQVHIC